MADEKKRDELAQARGRKLRQAFGLTDASPLQNRGLRNAFEHFDEDLDRFLLVNDAGTFFPDPRVGNHAIADQPTDKIFKLVDPDACICVLLGEKFSYEPIRREIVSVLNLAGGSDGSGRLPDPERIRDDDPNHAYSRYHQRWAPRLGLKDQYLAEAFERGRDPGWKHILPDYVAHIPGHVHILLVLETATLLGSIEPSWVDEMVEEWRHQLNGRKGDKRKITRKIIAQNLALNRHRGPESDLLLCAALWLIVTKSDAEEIVAMIRGGDVEVRYDISFLNDQQLTRFRLSARALSG